MIIEPEQEESPGGSSADGAGNECQDLHHLPASRKRKRKLTLNTYDDDDSEEELVSLNDNHDHDHVHEQEEDKTNTRSNGITTTNPHSPPSSKQG